VSSPFRPSALVSTPRAPVFVHPDACHCADMAPLRHAPARPDNSSTTTTTTLADNVQAALEIMEGWMVEFYDERRKNETREEA
jgi:hypothetical protein